jgi:hypothetical protein
MTYYTLEKITVCMVMAERADEALHDLQKFGPLFAFITRTK